MVCDMPNYLTSTQTSSIPSQTQPLKGQGLKVGDTQLTR